MHPAREGAPVGQFTLPSESQAHLLPEGALRDLIDREPRASVGVVASDADAARRFHALVAELPEARLVLHGEFSFEPGIDVTDVDMQGPRVRLRRHPQRHGPPYIRALTRLAAASTLRSHAPRTSLRLATGGAWSPLIARPAGGSTLEAAR